MTTARPILFSAPMVRALLEGRKTQTRRLAKFASRDGANLQFSGIAADRLTPSTWALVSRGAGGCWNERSQPWRCPYGVPGDLLWVRESWHLVHVGGGRGGGIEPFNSYDQMYMADGHREHFTFEGEGDPFLRFASDRPRPSMFMPRWASRLTLEITNVRVERLQDISKADAEAEGVEFETADPPFYYVPHIWPHSITGVGVEEPGGRHAVRCYGKLWDHINGPGSWDANPWVVALSFKVHKSNVDTYLSQRAEAA